MGNSIAYNLNKLGVLTMKTQNKTSDKQVIEKLAPWDYSGYVEAITHSLKAARQNMVQVGRTLVTAQNDLTKQHFKDMVDVLPITMRTAQKLMKIARDKRLWVKDIAEHLPVSWGSLYEIAKLNDEQIKQGIKDGVISPNAERKDITDFKDKLNGVVPKKRHDMNLREGFINKPIARIFVSEDIEPDDLKRILDLMDAMPKSAQAIRSEKVEDRVEKMWQRTAESNVSKERKEALKEAKEIVLKFTKRRMKKLPKGKKRKAFDHLYGNKDERNSMSVYDLLALYGIPQDFPILEGITIEGREAA